MKSEAHYRYSIPDSVVVGIDVYERKPIRFPSLVRIVHPENPSKRLGIKVCTKKVRIQGGDYRLEEYPNCCVVERKAGQRELFKNIFNPQDAVRQAKSFRKLSLYEYPYVLVELTPQEILTKNPHIPDVDALMHRVSLVFVKYGFHVLWIPWRSRKSTSRLQMGTFLVHLMLACALRRNLEILPEVATGAYTATEIK